MAKYSYQRLFGKVIHNHIPEGDLERKNRSKSWKYGYNEEYDFVCVSKNGTVGEIYELQNLKIGIPKAPPNFKIRFNELSEEEQYWKPYNIPKELSRIEDEAVSWNSEKSNASNLKTPTEIFFMKPDAFINKYLPFINEDFDRRENGEWIFVCGKPMWIPPSHYFFLQHSAVFGSKLPDFRFTNRDYYLFWEACIADPRSLGMIYLKNRRSGASTMAGSEMNNVGTQIQEGFLGIMSKTNRDSVSFLNKMVIRPFRKMVWYFKPQTSGTTSATSGLVFKDVAKRISTKNALMTAESGLDTSIKQFSTSLNSMDGEKVNIMVLDEVGKYPSDVPFDQYWSVAEECLTEGFKIVGKCMAVSTANSQAKGGKEFKSIYHSSDVRKRMENGRTATGLYSLFIPAEWNQEGGYDKFGYSIVDDPTYAVRNRDGDYVKKGNLSRLVEKADSLKRQSPVLYNEFLRKHPRTESHAFRDESNASDFDLNKIYEQMDYNELTRVKPERGNFVDTGVDGKHHIEWIPSFNGRFYVTWMPKEELRNNFEVKGSQIIPLNDFGCFGIDPYKVSQTVDNRSSKGAMHGCTSNSLNVTEIPDNEFFLEYIERPATVQMFMRDMMFAMLFYGLPALIENNVPNLLDELKRNNMTRFALRRRDKLKLSTDEKMLGGLPMTGEKVRQDHYFSIQTYIAKHVGEDLEGKYRDVNQMGNCPFNRMLDSWSKFNPQNRTSEDASISSGLAIMGNKMMFQHNRKSIDMKGFEGFGKQYNYGGGNIWD